MSINAITNAGQAVNDEQWSQELRLASPTGRPVEYVGGLFYFYQHQNNILYTYYGPDAGKFVGRPAFNNGTTTYVAMARNEQHRRVRAGHMECHERLSFTGGARETYEDKSTRFHRNDPIGQAGFQAAFPVYESGKLERHDANTSALVSSNFKFTDDVLGYASVARGAKAGGINPQVPTGGLTTESLYVNPETATDYELGIKTTAFDRRLQLNANLFLVDVKDYQATQLAEVTTGVFVQVLSNIGKVRSQGVEFELQAVPVQGLRVSLNGSYNDAVYRSYENAPCSAERIAAGLKVCDLTGSQVVGAPRWIASSALDYEHPIGDDLQVFGGVSYSWRSSFFGSADNSELARVKAYGLLNLRAGVGGDWGTNHWTASLWANNLTDKVYTVGGISSAAATLRVLRVPGCASLHRCHAPSRFLSERSDADRESCRSLCSISWWWAPWCSSPRALLDGDAGRYRDRRRSRTTRANRDDISAAVWRRADPGAGRSTCSISTCAAKSCSGKALALGLDRDDEIVRRRVVQKIEFLNEDTDAIEAEAEADLEKFFASHQSRYITPPTVSVTQRYFSADAGGEGEAHRRADAALARLKKGAATPAGDRFEGGNELAGLSNGDAQRLFGDSQLSARAVRGAGRRSGSGHSVPLTAGTS